MKRRLKTHFSLQKRRMAVLDLLWVEEEVKILKKKAAKSSATGKLQVAIRSMPTTVKNAVLTKWLQYMNHLYMSRLMLFRRIIHRLNSADPLSVMIYFNKEYVKQKQLKTKHLSHMFNTTEPGNLAENSLLFNDSMGKDKREIEEIPPLLDPVLCKDIKNFAKTIELHLTWLEKDWSVSTPSGDITHPASLKVPTKPENKV